MSALVKRTVAAIEANGQAHIVTLNLHVDVHNNCMPAWPKNINRFGKEFTFAMDGPKGRTIYKEATEDGVTVAEISDADKITQLEDIVESQDKTIRKLFAQNQELVAVCKQLELNLKRLQNKDKPQ